MPNPNFPPMPPVPHNTRHYVYPLTDDTPESRSKELRALAFAHQLYYDSLFLQQETDTTAAVTIEKKRTSAVQPAVKQSDQLFNLLFVVLLGSLAGVVIATLLGLWQ